MKFIKEFESKLTPELQKDFALLNTPTAIQNYLDSMPYIGEERDRSPLNVMLDKQSHCLDGGFFAALALWRIGFKPLLIDLVPEPGMDDDHVLALYQINGRWGAIAKSNYVNMGFRDAVYKSLRELAMTYFEHFITIDQQKSMRGYTRPFDASRYTKFNWAWDEAGANQVYYKHFYGRKSITLVPPKNAKNLQKVSDRAYKAETLYTNLNESFGNRPH